MKIVVGGGGWVRCCDNVQYKSSTVMFPDYVRTKFDAR